MPSFWTSLMNDEVHAHRSLNGGAIKFGTVAPGRHAARQPGALRLSGVKEAADLGRLEHDRRLVAPLADLARELPEGRQLGQRAATAIR